MSAILQDPLLLLRPMQETDLDQVLTIEEEAYEFPWTPGIFRDCLRVGYCCWVLALEERVVGYSVLSVAAGEGHILNLCVSPEKQRQGLGRKLLERALALASRHRADTVFLEVRASNKEAVALYESAGFNELGRRRGYYPARNGREDALLLAKSL